MRAPVAIVLALLSVPAGVDAQRSWTAIPAPYRPAADTGETPAFAFVTDSASRLMGLRPLREVSLPRGHRELRVWTGFGVTIPDRLLRIVESPDTVRGELVHWWSLTPDPANDSIFADFFDEMERAAGRYGCNERGGPDPAWGRQSSHRYTFTDWMTACKADYGGAEPAWRAVLARLRGVRAFTLPDPSTLEPEGLGVLDGVSVQVEVLDGGRYRTYKYSGPSVQPWPEAAYADSLLKLVYALEPEG